MVQTRLLVMLMLMAPGTVFPSAAAWATHEPEEPLTFPRARTQEEYEEQLKLYRQALVPKEAKVKIDAFRRAVMKKERETVALSLCYPVRIMFRDKQINVEDKASFLQYFDAVFTPRFMHTLEQIDWTPSVVDEKGITVGTGQIWFDMNGCVVTINNNVYVI